MKPLTPKESITQSTKTKEHSTPKSPKHSTRLPHPKSKQITSKLHKIQKPRTHITNHPKEKPPPNLAKPKEPISLRSLIKHNHRTHTIDVYSTTNPKQTKHHLKNNHAANPQQIPQNQNRPNIKNHKHPKPPAQSTRATTTSNTQTTTKCNHPNPKPPERQPQDQRYSKPTIAPKPNPTNPNHKTNHSTIATQSQRHQTTHPKIKS